MSSATRKPGFIGPGIAGAPTVLHRIQVGQPLFVQTRRKVPARVAGAIVRARPTVVAERADIVFTRLRDTPDMETLPFGKDGIASGLSKGRTVVDGVSISPIETKAFARQINALACDYLAAPVSGAEVGAQA